MPDLIIPDFESLSEGHVRVCDILEDERYGSVLNSGGLVEFELVLHLEKWIQIKILLLHPLMTGRSSPSPRWWRFVNRHHHDRFTYHHQCCFIIIIVVMAIGYVVTMSHTSLAIGLIIQNHHIHEVIIVVIFIIIISDLRQCVANTSKPFSYFFYRSSAHSLTGIESWWWNFRRAKRADDTLAMVVETSQSPGVYLHQVCHQVFGLRSNEVLLPTTLLFMSSKLRVKY